MRLFHALVALIMIAGVADASCGGASARTRVRTRTVARVNVVRPVAVIARPALIALPSGGGCANGACRNR